MLISSPTPSPEKWPSRSWKTNTSFENDPWLLIAKGYKPISCFCSIVFLWVNWTFARTGCGSFLVLILAIVLQRQWSDFSWPCELGYCTRREVNKLKKKTKRRVKYLYILREGLATRKKKKKKIKKTIAGKKIADNDPLYERLVYRKNSTANSF